MDNIDAFGVAILMLGVVVIGAVASAFRDSRRMAATDDGGERSRLWKSMWFMLTAVLVYLPAVAVLSKFWWEQR